MSFINTYKDISVSTEVLGASPWQQIQMLLDKLKECIKLSEQAMHEDNVSLKCQKILRAEDIVCYLRECLQNDADKVLSQKLDGIYDHLQKILFLANARNDPQYLTAAAEITNNLIQWWTNAKS